MSEKSNYMFDGKIDLRQVKRFDFIDRAKTLWQGIKFIYKSKTYDGSNLQSAGAVICSGATASQPIFTKWQFVPNAAFADAMASQYGEDLSGFSGGSLLDVINAVLSMGAQMGEFPSGWEEFTAWLGGRDHVKNQIKNLLTTLESAGESIICGESEMTIDSATTNMIMEALNSGTVSGILNGLLSIEIVFSFLGGIQFDGCLTESGNIAPQIQFGQSLTISVGSNPASTEVIQQ